MLSKTGGVLEPIMHRADSGTVGLVPIAQVKCQVYSLGRLTQIIAADTYMARRTRVAIFPVLGITHCTLRRRKLIGRLELYWKALRNYLPVAPYHKLNVIYSLSACPDFTVVNGSSSVRYSHRSLPAVCVVSKPNLYFTSVT